MNPLKEVPSGSTDIVKLFPRTMMLLAAVLICGLSVRAELAAQSISSTELEQVSSINLPPVRYLRNSAGADIAYYAFQPEGKARAALLFYHDAGRRVGVRYPILARRLVLDHRIAVYLVDIRGHGHLRVGLRGDITRTTRVWKDVREMTARIRNLHPGLRIYLGGHSRGAGLILNYSTWKNRLRPDGYVFLAPNLGKRTRRTAALDLAGAYPLATSCAMTNGEPARADYPAANLHRENRANRAVAGKIFRAVTPRNPRAQFRKLDRPAAVFIGARDERFRPRAVIAIANLIRTRKIARILPGSGHFSILLETAAPIARFMDM